MVLAKLGLVMEGHIQVPMNSLKTLDSFLMIPVIHTWPVLKNLAKASANMLIRRALQRIFVKRAIPLLEWEETAFPLTRFPMLQVRLL